MEYKCTVNFTLHGINDLDVEKRAKELLKDLDFVYGNLNINCIDDELVEHLEMKGFVQVSTYREKVITALETAGVNGLMPTEIACECGIKVNHISKTLKELVDKDLIQCINPKARKGRIYRLTDKGEIIGGML